MRIAYIGIIIAMMMECIMPSLSLMQFQYECEGKDATATTYCYLREPRTSESNYTIGLKSGSFNYLEGGDMDIKENINYNYGNGTNISDSTVDHTLEVDFEGKRGISEFFSRGFFDNNRWISAWKKIRYEESPSVMIKGKLMDQRPSNYIKVRASTRMDSSINKSSYNLNYIANIKNGVIETKDATGWTNRSGSRKYDWEHETRTVGDELNITNILYDSNPIKSAGGLEGDWLPCCFKGTVPSIIDRLQADYNWPSNVMIATLQADTKLPNRMLTSKQIVPAQLASVSLTSVQFGNIYAKQGIKIGTIASVPEIRAVAPVQYGRQGLKIGAITSIPDVNVVAPIASAQPGDLYYAKNNLKIGMVTSFPDFITKNSTNETVDISINPPNILEATKCNEESCSGYDCIYTYDQDTAGVTTITGAGGAAPKIGELRRVIVDVYAAETSKSTTWEFSDGVSDPANKVRYNITVTNLGDVALNEVNVTADMPIGRKFERNAYYGTGRGELKVIRDPEIFNIETRNKLIWNIGTLQPKEEKAILLDIYIKKNIKNIDIRDISVKVVGNDPNGDLVRNSKDSAIIVECYQATIDSLECQGRDKELPICQYTACADWINQSI